MSKFKVGDKVRVRRDFKNELCHANHEMMKKRGEVAKIINVGKLVNGKIIYYLDVDNCFPYVWTDEMLEPVEEFKIGDRVRIREGIKSRSKITDELIKQLLGKTAVITKVIDTGKIFKNIYYLDIDKGKRSWFDNALELVEEVEIGDTVEIIEGELKGIRGEIIDTNMKVAQIEIDDLTSVIIRNDSIRLIKKAKEEGLYISQMNEGCKYILDGDRTTIILPSGVKGQVKLYKGDRYDKDLGMSLAYHKAKFNEILKRNELKENN